MDDRHFDQVARALAGAAGTRRVVLRFLAGGALGMLAARLGLAEDAAAKRTTRKRRPERKRPGAKLQGPLQAERRRKKGKGKGKKKARSLPPGCQHCGTCQMCQNGRCVPDPDLDLVRCLDSADDPGGQCHVCDNGRCAPLGHGSVCADGEECSWCQNGQCQSCTEGDQCARCESGVCLYTCGECETCQEGACVPDPERDLLPCGESPYDPLGRCHVCHNGQCAMLANGSSCTDGDRCEWCQSGECLPMPEEECCHGERRCDDGSCIPEDQCCPDATSPSCSSQCGDILCEDGEQVCRPRRQGETCGGVGTACCNGVCYSTGCGTGSNGQPRHFNPNNCRCECEEVLECPPGQGFSHADCECVCNCNGRCCITGCCKHPGPFGSNYCCGGY